jgi:predicted phosphodiesterase
MRVALFADVHGNISGLKAVLAQLDRLGGADVVVGAGDLIGGGPGTEDLLDLLIERDVRLLLGNAEEASLDIETAIQHVAEERRRLSYETVAWLHARIAQPYWDLLASLPLSLTVEAGPNRRLFVCHAAPTNTWERVCSPRAPLADLRRAYGAVDAEVVAYGHWHEHHVLPLDGKLLVNVASVGFRRDGLSVLALVEYVGERWVIRHWMVPYDTAEEERLTRERAVPQP